MTSQMNVDELHGFLAAEFPQVNDMFRVEEVRSHYARVRLLVSEAHLRPGGTVSGPTMFSLADCSMYIALLASIGPEALAVTTNCAIDFMRKPEAADMIAEAEILKLGRVLAVGDVRMRMADGDKTVARASLTYSIPPKGG